MTEMNELAEKMQETVRRANELLQQKSEEGVRCPCGHCERIALRQRSRGDAESVGNILAEEA